MKEYHSGKLIRIGGKVLAELDKRRDGKPYNQIIASLLKPKRFWDRLFKN